MFNKESQLSLKIVTQAIILPWIINVIYEININLEAFYKMYSIIPLAYLMIV